jgi:hypothetical protein
MILSQLPVLAIYLSSISACHLILVRKIGLSVKIGAIGMGDSMAPAGILKIISGIIGWILAFFVALLPERIKAREPFTLFNHHLAHILSGIVECILALALFVYGYDNFVGGLSARAAHALADGTAQSISESELRRMGVYAYILYLMHPVALTSLYMFMEGNIRAFAAISSGRCHGIGFFWLIDRIFIFAQTRHQKIRLNKQLGPHEPDSVFKDQTSGALIITSVENKPWQERQIARQDEDFYILAAIYFVLKDRYYRHQYTFRPLRPGEIIRGSVVVIPGNLPASPKPSFETKKPK